MSSPLTDALQTILSYSQEILTILLFATSILSVILMFLTDRSGKIARPPGIFILSIINFIYSRKVAERIFEPILADMQEEYFEALSNSLKLKAKWIHLRSIISIFIAIVSQLSISIVKLFITIWKIS